MLAARRLGKSVGLTRAQVRAYRRLSGPGQPLHCERPRVVQKLVSADVVTCPHHDGIKATYQSPRIVKVRICRRKDLERACPPKFCKCPQKSPPKSFGQILCGITKLGAKGMLAAAIVYWTSAEGIWGDSSDSENLYIRIHDNISTDPNFQSTNLPNLERIRFQILDRYNRLVLLTMGVLVGIPMKVGKAINDVLYPCEPVEEEEVDPKKKKK